MFTRAEQQLVKQILLTIGRYDLPIFYLPWRPAPAKELAAATAAVNALDDIPWPDMPCIILAEDPVRSILGQSPGLWAHLPRDVSEPAGLPMYFMNTWTAWSDGPGALRAAQSPPWVMHRRPADHTYCADLSDAEADISRVLQHFPTHTAAQAQAYREYDASTRLPPSQGRWLSCDMADYLTYLDTGQPPVVTDMPPLLRHLFNLVTPCGYFVRSRFRHGFGTSSVKKLTRQKPIFSLIDADRLHNVYRESQPLISVTPHFRRGHLAWQWKRAGLNRLTLPRDPGARLLLRQRHQVESVYRPPTWVGERSFSTGECDHRVIVEGVQYRGLRPILPPEEDQA